MRRRSSRPRRFATEAALAAQVVGWLRGEGWWVAQEVEHRGAVADIVATRGEEVAVVECKLSLNLKVLDQAHGWIGQATAIYVAVPFYGPHRKLGAFGRTVCRALGVGLLEVRTAAEMGESQRFRIPLAAVLVAVDAPPTGSDGARLRAVLRPEHETFAAAGSPTGHRWTAFKATAKALAEHVAAHPGELAADVLRAVPHHWQGRRPEGRACVVIRRGLVAGVEVRVERGRARLYPVAAPAEEARGETTTGGVTVSGATEGGSQLSAPNGNQEPIEVELQGLEGPATERGDVPPHGAPAPPPSPTATSTPRTRRRRRARPWQQPRGTA